MKKSEFYQVNLIRAGLVVSVPIVAKVVSVAVKGPLKSALVKCGTNRLLMKETFEAVVEAVSKVKSGTINIFEDFAKITKVDNGFEFTTKNGTIFTVADSEIPATTRTIVVKAANIFSKFTSGEITNLKNIVIKEGQALKDAGLTNKQLGPAVAGVYSKRTGKFYIAINNTDGKIPSELSSIIESRIKNMPQEVLDSYNYTLGAGSHAEVYAVNKAILAESGTSVDDLLIYVNKTGGTSTPVTELPFHTCPHCEYILGGFNVFSDLQ